MEEKRIDTKQQTPKQQAVMNEQAQLLHQFNNALPYSEEWWGKMKELFMGKMGENSRVMTPLTVVRPEDVTIGKNAVVMNGCLMMSAGGITIDDGVLVAANVQLISNNHDPYDRSILLCRPIHLCEGSWVGAGATILPGVTIGKHAIVGAASVVTKDVPDYAVAVGNPARVIKYLDKDKFE